MVSFIGTSIYISHASHAMENQDTLLKLGGGSERQNVIETNFILIPYRSCFQDRCRFHPWSSRGSGVLQPPMFSAVLLPALRLLPITMANCLRVKRSSWPLRFVCLVSENAKLTLLSDLPYCSLLACLSWLLLYVSGKDSSYERPW